MFPSSELTSTSKFAEAGRVVSRNRLGRRLVLVLATFAAVVSHLFGPEQATSQVVSPGVVVTESECKVKYVYLYSFGLLTKWPESTFKQTGGNFVIGVLGDKPFGHILDAIAKRKTIGDRRIVIRRFKTIEEYTSCHILYVTESVDEKECLAASEKLNEKPVLIVGETEGFEFSGGVIAFRIENENVKFSLNVDAVKRRHLMVSARLSRLASVVRDKDRRGPVSTAENR